jgi:hypothetical protein
LNLCSSTSPAFLNTCPPNCTTFQTLSVAAVNLHADRAHIDAKACHARDSDMRVNRRKFRDGYIGACVIAANTAKTIYSCLLSCRECTVPWIYTYCPFGARRASDRTGVSQAHGTNAVIPSTTMMKSHTMIPPVTPNPMPMMAATTMALGQPLAPTRSNSTHT